MIKLRLRLHRPTPIHIILVAYILFTIFAKDLVQDQFFLNVIKPIIFSAIGLYIYKKTNNYHGRFKNVKDNKLIAIIMALIYIVVYSLLGLIFGFSHSIYSHDFLMILRNIYQITFIIVLYEYIRSYLINLNTKSKAAIIINTLIFIALSTNFSILASKLSDGDAMFKYLSSTILPNIAINILCSYLAIKGGYRLTIPYRVILSLFMLLTPVTPAFDWFLTGIFEILFSGITLLVIRKFSQKPTDVRRENKKHPPVINIMIFSIMVIFTLFVYGLFKYKPIVILSNSMHPVFNKGDVVVYYVPSEEKKNDLDNGTVIVYTKDNQYVVHRIIRKFTRSGKTLYVTKGDANNTDDYLPVSTEDIVGVYVLPVKYIGYPSVWLNQAFNDKQAVVETK